VDPLEIRFKPKSRLHISQASSFYASRADGRLVARFLRDLDEALEQLSAFPESGAESHRKTRRLVLKRFPYSIYYRVHPKFIEVYAVLHGMRDPRFLKRESQ